MTTMTEQTPTNFNKVKDSADKAAALALSQSSRKVRNTPINKKLNTMEGQPMKLQTSSMFKTAQFH